MKKGVHNTIAFVTGRKGSGKSTLVAAMIAEHRRAFVLDTMGEFGEAEGCEVFEGLDACLDAIEANSDAKRFRISLRVADTDDGLTLLGVLYQCERCLIVVEEASFYCSPSKLPREIAQLVRLGRHHEIDQIYVSQRPASIHRDVTASADLIIAFQTHEARDVAYLGKLSDELGERVRELPPYRVAVWGDIEKAPLSVIAAMHVSLDKSTRER